MRSTAVIALLTKNAHQGRFTQVFKRGFAFLFFFIFLNNIKAQVSITQLGTPYTENFNGMTNSNNATLPSGFKYGSDWTTATNNNWVATTLATGTSAGTSNLTGSIGGFYNFANGDSTTSTDRAIGFFTNGIYKSRRSILFAFTNNTNSTVTSINLSWNYEKYRNGTLASLWNFYHGNTTNSVTINNSVAAVSGATSLTFSSTTGVNSGMMVAAASGISPNTVVTSATSTIVGINVNTIGAIALNTPITFSSTANTAATAGDTSYAVDLNTSVISPTSGAKNFTLSGLSIPNGSTYYLRWTYYSGNFSTTSGQALGIDDFSISLSDGSCAPSVQGKIDSITNVTNSQMTLNYTRGNGDSVLIVASTNSSLSSDPVNGALYTASSTYGSGTALGGGFVVYKDIAGGRNSTNNTLTITGLTSSTPYYYYLYEFNKSGTGVGSCYKISAATLNQNTTSAANDHYRSRQSTQWSDPNTWETSNDSLKWVNSTLKPTSSAKSILVKDSVTITNTAESAKLLTIASGAKLTYITGTGYPGGSTLTIVDDGTAAFDFNIYGTYVVFGNPATLTSPATAKIFNGGIIRADANSGGLSDNFAFNTSVYFTNGAIFEWNTSVALNSSTITYFKYNNAQPTSDVAIFRVSKPLSLGASGATTINGLFEANARVVFSGSGNKVFRNGRIGSGNVIQTAGTFLFTDNATWGGSGIDSLNINYGLRISAGTTTTLIANKTIQAGPLYVDGTLSLSNYDLTLASTAVGTASLGKMGTSGVINYSGTGRFVVERYISTGTHGKSWQLLATPTWGDNQTINAAWQEGATSVNQNRVPGYGTQITGFGGWVNGFDVNTTSPSIKSYDATSNSWIGISRTDTTLYNKKGFMIFVRGDRSVTAYNQAATPTILRTRGKLYDKINTPVATIVGAGKLESIGNPFSSTIDFLTVQSEATSGLLDQVLYLWDPTLSTLGGWQTFSGPSSYVPSTPNTFYPNSSNTKIQSGQAFFVKSTSGATVNFSENAKVSDSRLVNKTPVNVNQLSMLSAFLTATINNETKVIDGNRIVFDNVYSNNVDENDAVKIINPGENFGINKHDTLISVEARNLISINDTIFYSIANLNQPSYKITIVPQKIVSRGLNAIWVDKFLNTKTPINLSDSNFINFSITTDLASRASDRFMLIFKRSNISLPFVSEGQNYYSKIVKLSPKDLSPIINVLSNPVTRDNIQIHFKALKPEMYFIEVNNMSGQCVYKENLFVNSELIKKIKISGSAGLYKLNVISKTGITKTLCLLVN